MKHPETSRNKRLSEPVAGAVAGVPCPARSADRNFKGPSYTLGHVRYRLKRDTGVLERGLGSVGALRGRVVKHSRISSELRVVTEPSPFAPETRFGDTVSSKDSLI